MSDILFGQSYYLRFDPKLWEAMQPYPPLGTLYAAAVMRQRGFSVSLYDAMLAQSEAEWAAALDRERPRWAVLFEDNFNYLSKMCLLRMRQAAFTMIQMARQRGCTVLVCGADASDQCEAYLDQGAHYILRGEGEITLMELLDQLSGRSQTPPAAIPGLAYRDSQGALVQTGRRPDLTDLDSLPFPAWDLVDIPRYRSVWLQRHGIFSMNMVTTRGCPYHCNWCAKPIWGQRYNSRSPENVVAELKWLHAHYAPDHIWFVDDILGLKPGWLSHFADLLGAEQLAIPFKCLSRVDLLLRGGAIDALRRAGCQIVWVGAESGAQQILDAMDKGTRVPQIYAASTQLHAAGVGVGFFLQFGYPGEGWDQIQQTLQMVRDCQPDDIGMSVSYPLPGTQFHAAVQAQLGAKRNWTDSNDLAMMYQGPYTTAFYRQLHKVLHMEFRLRRTWQQLRQARHPGGHSGAQRSHSPLGWRSLAALLYHGVQLPWQRLRLRLLARIPGTATEPLPPLMTPTDAATPTPQGQ